MDYIIVVLYCLSLLLIFFFSLGQLHLAWHYLRKKKQVSAGIPPVLKRFPVVTVQLPLYNEQYVTARLIDAICHFNYPKDKLEIQVLDDSTDDTLFIAAEKVREWASRGVDIKHIRRPERIGFKAGALQYGLERAKGEFIAIFDADFLPDTDFLTKTLPSFSPAIGLVQSRWGHLNDDYCLLTNLQAFGLNAHFTIEQAGRSAAGSFINFNGTGGVWRKTCIIDAGGWSADTLTEDLDLSYRAQLKGWKFSYLESVVTPAELPVIMSAVKSQQYRWNKGAAETARKNLLHVLRSKMKFSGKLHATFHLLNSSIFLCLFLAAILSIPMLFITAKNAELQVIFHLASIFLIGFFSIAFFYWVSARQTHPTRTVIYYLTTFPAFLIVSMGMSLHNGVAVLEGLLGIKSPFIRTPKFNITHENKSWNKNVYIQPKINGMIVLEGLLSLYFMFGIFVAIYLGNWELILFHLMLATGFACVFYYSVKPVKYG